MPSEIKILLYVFLGIGYLFYTFYKKAIRDQQKKLLKPTPSKRSSDDIFEELKRQMRGEDNKDEHEEKETVKPEEVKKKFKEIPSLEYQPDLTMVKPLAVERDPFSDAKPITDHQDDQTDLVPGNLEDMRKAVIWSEILKRPRY
jgi:hypothetical protein